MPRTFQIQIQPDPSGPFRVYIRREASDPCVSISTINRRLARRILPLICKAHGCDVDTLWRGDVASGKPDSTNPHAPSPNWRTFDNWSFRPGDGHSGEVCGYFGTNGTMGRLTRWTGDCFLQCRYETVTSYPNANDGDGGEALAFRLTNRRWIVGYSLGSGMLFRGYLLSEASEDEARRAARDEAERLIYLDAEDDDEEQDEDDIPIGATTSPRVSALCTQIAEACGIDPESAWRLVAAISNRNHDFSGDTPAETEDFRAATSLLTQVTRGNLCSNSSEHS